MKNLKSTLKTWIKLWPESWAIPAALIVLALSYFILPMIDPAIGTFDLGTLQILLFSAIITPAISFLTFLGIQYNDKNLWEYYKRKYEPSDGKPVTGPSDEHDFENITAWQRLKLLYLWRAYLLGLQVAVLVSLM